MRSQVVERFVRSDAWRFRWLPLFVAVAGVLTAYYLQEIPFFRRHALLIALFVGMGFFVPPIRHRLLILFAYGLSLYFLSKSLGTWLDAPFGGLGTIEQVVWFFIGILCGISAFGMGQRHPPAWAVSVLLMGLSLYFGTYTYHEFTQNNWLQVLAGVGLTLVAFGHALVNWVEGARQQET